jgi:hypothetical protein
VGFFLSQVNKKHNFTLMALLLAAGLVGAGAMHLSMRAEESRRELDYLVHQARKYSPQSGQFQSQAKVVGLANTGRVQSSIKDVDLRGVPFHWLKYGDNTWTKKYGPPGLSYQASQDY